MSPWETFWIIPGHPLLKNSVVVFTTLFDIRRITGQWACDWEDVTRLITGVVQRFSFAFVLPVFFCFFFDYKVDVHLVFQFPTYCYELFVDFFGILSVKKVSSFFGGAFRVFSFISNRDSFTSSFSLAAQRFNGEKSFEEIAHSARQRPEGTPISL